MNNSIKYDRDSYKKHLQELEAKRAELQKVLEELADTDRRIIECWFISNSARDLTQQALKLQREIADLENKNIEIIDTTEETSKVSIGHIYKAIAENKDGSQIALTFKLVSENPAIKIGVGEISDISINSPLGASILGKEIGGTYHYDNFLGGGKVTILEEVIQNESDEGQEM